ARHAELLRGLGADAAQDHRRRAVVVFHHFHVVPAEAHGVAERLHRGLFRREASGERRRRVAVLRAVRALRLGEHTLHEARAVLLHAAPKPADLADAEAEADDHRATASRNARTDAAMPTSTASLTSAWPMFSSSISGAARRSAPTFAVVSPWPAATRSPALFA